MAMKILEDRLIEEFAERYKAGLPMAFDADMERTPRRLWLYTKLPIRHEWIQDLLCESILEILPETQSGKLQALPETVVAALRGTLTGTLGGTPRYVRSYPKQAFPERGDYWMACVYLDKLMALGHQAIKQGKKAFIARQIVEERRNEPQFVSVRSITQMMCFIDTCSTREALEIKAWLHRLKFVRTNGHERTKGSEIIVPCQ